MSSLLSARRGGADRGDLDSGRLATLRTIRVGSPLIVPSPGDASRYDARPASVRGGIPSFGDLRPSLCLCRAASFFVPNSGKAIFTDSALNSGMDNEEAIGMLVGLVVFGAVISGAILIAVIVVL